MRSSRPARLLVAAFEVMIMAIAAAACSHESPAAPTAASAAASRCGSTSTTNVSPEQQELEIDVACNPLFQNSWSIDVPWITLTGAHLSGTLLDFLVRGNTGPERIGRITIGQEQITVIQGRGDCVIALAPTGEAFDENGGTGIITITGVPGCAWDATAYAVSASGGLSPTLFHGSGGGVLAFNLGVNTSPFDRAPFFVIGGTQRFQITQSACPITVSNLTFRVTALGGGITIPVTSRDICHWTDYSNDSFIVRVFEEHIGSGTVQFVVAPNLTGTARSGSLFVAGKTVVVTQDP